MKVLLFTVHRTLNYGSVLQTYACKEIFSSIGIDMFVADYSRPTDYSVKSVSSLCEYFKMRKRTRNVNSFMAWIKCLATSVASYQFTRKFWDNCNSFLVNHVELTAPLLDMNISESVTGEYDLLCSGSDQIWNSDYNNGTDEVFLLAFAPENSIRFSLASSIGKDILSEQDINLFKQHLRLYKGISVREKKAKDLLAQIGISAKQVLDPTLWIKKEIWEAQSAARLIPSPYILLYKLKADNMIDRIADLISRKLGKKIVRICFSNMSNKRDNNIENYTLPKVEEFLSLIRYADFIVTNSFHGTCFSINFNRPFISVARERFNSRIENILDVLNLKERMCYSAENFSFDLCNEIDYDTVNSILQKQREECFNWLKQITILDNKGGLDS